MKLDPQVTNAYAEALFALSRRQGQAAALTEKAEGLSRLVDENRRLRGFLEAPHIPKPAKVNLVNSLVRPNYPLLLVDLMLFLLRKSRIEYLREILDRFQVLVQIDQGIYPATLSTAHDISFAEKLLLKGALEKFTGKQLKVTYRVVPGILGGVIFTAQDLHIDDSLLGHLKRLRERLQAVAVH